MKVTRHKTTGYKWKKGQKPKYDVTAKNKKGYWVYTGMFPNKKLAEKQVKKLKQDGLKVFMRKRK